MSNYDFLQSLLTTIPEDVRNISLYGYITLIVISIIAALLISHLYVKFFDANSTGSRIHRAFPLLGPAVTTIFLTVQFSLPLSLGLLGALSIVRFRTPIKEPEEIGFILLVIACSISIATFNIAFTALLYITVFIFLFIQSRLPNSTLVSSNAAVLNIRMNKSTASSIDDLDSIVEMLSQKKIKHTVSNIHSDSDKTNISILLKNYNENNFAFIKQLDNNFNDINIDFYRR